MPAKPTVQQTRQEMARRGVIDLTNNTPSLLAKTIDSAQPDKPEGGVGTSTITGKSSVQHDWGEESLAKAKGYSAPSLTQDQPEDASVGSQSSAKNKPEKEQHIAIGKSAVPQSLLTANVKKQQAKTDMLATKEEVALAEETSAWDAMGRMWDGIGTAVSRAFDTLQGDEENAIKFGSYVSPEKRAIYNKMMEKAKKGAYERAFDGVTKYGPVGATLGMVGGATSMLEGLIGAIQENQDPNDEAAQKVEDNFREQRQNMEEYLDKYNKNYRIK